MTKEQLEALIDFIKEQAAYEADKAATGCASHRYVKDAEDRLRAAFQTKSTVGETHV